MSKAPKHFKPSPSAEIEFARALRKVGKMSGHMVETHVVGATLYRVPEMQKALADYSELIDPWARRQAAKMLLKVSQANRKSYIKSSAEMGKLIRNGVANKEVGEEAAAKMHETVKLIKSIPLKAGERAQKLALEAIYNGTRASEIAEALMNSGKVSESTATLIARTEVARANASITEARAQAIGAQSYIWRTTMDGAERDSHAKMNGKTVLYSKPPTLEDGTTGHAGTFPNCRCYQDVQFDNG